MPFPYLTKDEVLAQIQDSLTEEGSELASATEGSRWYRIMSGLANAISRAFALVGALVDSFFVGNATGDWLRRRVKDFRMEPGEGSKAAGSVIAVAPAGRTPTLAMGTILTTADGLLGFEVRETKVLGTTPQAVAILARDVGAKYNLSPGTRLYASLSELQGVSFKTTYTFDAGNPVPVGGLQGGVNAMTDAEIRTALPQHIRAFARGVEFAVLEQLQTIGGLEVVGLRSGDPVPGYFKIITTNESISVYQRAQAEAILAEYGAAGIGFEFQTLVRRYVPIAITIHGVDGTIARETYRIAAESAVMNHLNNLAVGQTLYVSALVAAAKVAGVDNVIVTAPAADVPVLSSELISTDSLVVTVKLDD